MHWVLFHSEGGALGEDFEGTDAASYFKSSVNPAAKWNVVKYYIVVNYIIPTIVCCQF